MLSAQVIETDRMECILQDVKPYSLIFIDIDDTLIDFDIHLGCKEWRSRVNNSPLRELHDPLTYYIAQQIQMRPVEPKMVELVRELQNRGHFLFPLTAREKNCWYDMQSVAGVDEMTYAING